ncbi:MAG: 30S ribosomal protein S16 [Patescibacteria group bacterium]|jgi:small subunit ribosomal protein S16
MVTIRLSRVGKRKQPTYRFVVQEKGRDPWGSHIEIVGHCNLRSTPTSVVLKTDRVQYWLSQGAQPSDTVWNMLLDQKLVTGDKRKTVVVSKKKKAKMAEVVAKAAAEKSKEEEKVKAAEAANAAEATPEVTSEAPTEPVAE